MRTIQHKHIGGFTIVETLVTVLMLSIALVALTTILTRTVDVTAIAQNRLIASNIALQGVELIRSKRDANLLCIWDGCGAVSSWTANLIGEWKPDITDANVMNAGVSFAAGDYSSFSNAYMCLSAVDDATKGQYTYCDGAGGAPGTGQEAIPGGFQRVVRVAAVQGGSTYSVSVESQVRWGDESVVVETILYNLE
jgi:Tfp pilus assembly protein PilV